jgi:DNA-binding NtrC family response regulator
VVVICPNVVGGATLTEVLAMRFSVLRTTRPAECLRALAHERPDAVVVDLSRLDTDVVCLLRTVSSRHPGCPVIGLGNAEAGRAVLAANLLLSAFLSTPVDANALLDRLGALIGEPAAAPLFLVQAYSQIRL